VSAAPCWIRKPALVLLHGESLSLFGGSPGLRDEGLLDAALDRPLNLLACGQHPDLADLAAASAHGLARNHPFVDGNKRAAFLSIGLFLHLNGQRFQADPLEAIRTIFAHAAGEVGEPQLADWIRLHASPGHP
jgi:death-on-curing protein